MRILVISQYPIKPAIHGGQKRTAAIVSLYRKRHEVRHVAVYWPNTYTHQHETKNSTHLVVSDTRLIAQLQLHPERSDLLLGRALPVKSKRADELRGLISVLSPEVIHIEQPYLVPAVRAILTDMKSRSVIVHGSQNVEHMLKKGIYGQILPRKDLDYLFKNTKAVEYKAIELADINIGVSQSDIKVFQQHKKGIWLLAGNGTDQITNSPGRSKQMKQHSDIIFIGSAHPPNYIGVESLLKDTRFLEAKSSLLLIGGIAGYLLKKYPKDDLFWMNKVALGQVNEKDLRKYIKQAEIIVLPINAGGGSNLKTAEAIASRKKIVGTSFAFRGYEQYKSFPNVFIANTADEFKDQLTRAMQAEYEPYTAEQSRLIENLSWKYTLRSLMILPYYARVLLFMRMVKGLYKK